MLLGAFKINFLKVYVFEIKLNFSFKGLVKKVEDSVGRYEVD